MIPRRMLMTLAVVILLASPALAAPDGPQVGDPAPDFTLEDTSETEHMLSAYQDQVLLLMIIGYG